MVEMRWVEREIIPKGIVGVIPKEKVLQYRTGRVLLGSLDVVWSEWIDVPTVTDSTV